MPESTSPTARPTYGNWKLPSRPGIGALGLLGTAVLLGGIILTLLTALVSWAAAIGVALVVILVTIPLAIRTPDGRSGFSLVASRASWALRRLSGQTEYRSGPFSGLKSGRFSLPGPLSATRVLEGQDAHGQAFGVIHDDGVNTFTAVLECDPDGGALVDPGQADTWVAGWGAWLAELAHEPGLLGVAVVVESAPDPGTRLAAEVLRQLDPAAPDAARKVMNDVVTAYPAASSETHTYVALTFRPVAGASRLASKADRAAEMISSLAVRVPPLAAALSAAGAGAAWPLPPDQIADAVRTAYDPSIAAAVAEARSESGSTGQAWDCAGPSVAVEGNDFYRHEAAVSRTWMACDAPRGSVRSGILRSLLEPSARIARKRVAILYRPVDQASAARIVEADRRSAHFMAASTAGLVNARASTAVRAAEQTAAEEASGASLTEFALVVTATVNSHDQLRAADAEISNLAASARLRFRAARGQQANAFTVALPAGVLPWLRTLVPYHLRSAL
jgi:hypothetical protein